MKTIFLCFIGILIAPIYFVAAAKPDYRVFLTADAVDDVPKESPGESFDCHQKYMLYWKELGLKRISIL